MKIFLLESDHNNTYNLFRAREISYGLAFSKNKGFLSYLYHNTYTYDDDDDDNSTPRDMYRKFGAN